MAKHEIRSIKLEWQSRSFRWSVYFSLSMLFISIWASFLANDLPVLIIKNNGLSSPVVKQLFNENYQLEVDPNDSNILFVLYPPVKWSPGKSDYVNSNFKGPFDPQFKISNENQLTQLTFRDRHWLGTGLRGNDILAGIIHGAGISLRLSFLSAIIAAFIGLFIGGIAAWFGDDILQLSRWKVVIILLFFIPVIHFLNIADLLSRNEKIIGILVWIVFFIAFLRIEIILKRYSFFNKYFTIPLDSIIQRILEFFTAFPKIVMILVVAAFWKASFLSILFLLILIGWADFARLVRAEFLQIKTNNYIEYARLTGAGPFHIIRKHILPNALAPLITTFVYLMASNILIEAGLSFLGVGMPANYVTWGTLLADGKENFAAWWLIIFPGLALTLTIASFHRIILFSSKK